MLLLVADDNKINLKVACAYLRSLGIPEESIQTAANGREATELCRKTEFNLIFMDIQMPEVDGIQAAKEILENHPHKPPIVALTANTSQEAEAKYRAVGMKMVLHKPVTKSAFEDALKLAI